MTILDPLFIDLEPRSKKPLTKEQKEALHESFCRFLCGLLGRDQEDWKSVEAPPVTTRNSQEVPIFPMSPPSSRIHFMELRITK